MSDITFADIFITLLICGLIAAILSLVQRGKKPQPGAGQDDTVSPADEKQEKQEKKAEDH